MKKLLIPISILLIAAACGKQAQVQPDQNQSASQVDETANWKTYTNAKYGFEFKYPQDWKVTTCTSEKIEGILFNDEGEITDCNKDTHTSAFIWIYKSNLERYPGETYDNFYLNTYRVVDKLKEEEFKIQGAQDGKKFTRGKADSFLFHHNNYSFSASADRTNSDENMPEIIEQFDKIMASFKFTN